MLRLLMIADDFTGALDTGVPQYFLMLNRAF